MVKDLFIISQDLYHRIGHFVVTQSFKKRSSCSKFAITIGFFVRGTVWAWTAVFIYVLTRAWNGIDSHHFNIRSLDLLGILNRYCMANKPASILFDRLTRVYRHADLVVDKDLIGCRSWANFVSINGVALS